MNNETVFLTKYGLRHYVTSARISGTSVFSIDATQCTKMIDHAHDIINEMFGTPSTILVV